MADEQEPLIDESIASAVEDSGAGMDFGGGMLSQTELDSLLAAAQHEEAAAFLDVPASEPLLPDMDFADPEPPAPSVLGLPSFDAMPAAVSDTAHGGMGRVRDIPLEVTVELGRTRLLIKDILELGTGSIIELDKLAGEPVDLFANGLLVARGEVIVIDDNFGVRVTEIITAADRKREAEANERAA